MFLIHSSPGGSEKPHLNEKPLKHIIATATPKGASAGMPQENGKVNRLGIKVRVTQPGSMTGDLFLRFAEH